MNLRLPFYGMKGTIAEIEENDNNFVVSRYGMSAKEKIVFNVVKNDKNCDLLKDNFYSDLSGYLNKNANKYESYKIGSLKKKIDMNMVSIFSSISIIMLASSVPLLLTHSYLGYVGIVLDVLSVPLLIKTTDLKLKNKNDEKKNIFINEYHNYEEQLRLYRDEKTKRSSLTQYKGLNNNKDNETVRDISLIKEKKMVMQKES